VWAQQWRLSIGAAGPGGLRGWRTHLDRIPKRKGYWARRNDNWHSILLKNFLSFARSHSRSKLNALNVLIGPNGSGKSNLIEAILLYPSNTEGHSEGPSE